MMSDTRPTPQDLSDKFRPPTRFLRIRTFLLGCIFFLSFVWAILLCITVFVQWPNMSIIEHNMLSIMLFIEFFTIILIPVLLAKEFRLWLDAARSLFLFASHFGIAVWFACEAPSMKCVTGGNEQDICSSLILLILIFSWVIPVLVSVYACGLTYLYYRLSNVKATTIESEYDPQKHQKTIASDATFHTSWHVSRASSGYAV